MHGGASAERNETQCTELGKSQPLMLTWIEQSLRSPPPSKQTSTSASVTTSEGSLGAAASAAQDAAVRAALGPLLGAKGDLSAMAMGVAQVGVAAAPATPLTLDLTAGLNAGLMGSAGLYLPGAAPVPRGGVGVGVGGGGGARSSGGGGGGGQQSSSSPAAGGEVALPVETLRLLGRRR